MLVDLERWLNPWTFNWTDSPMIVEADLGLCASIYIMLFIEDISTILSFIQAVQICHEIKAITMIPGLETVFT